METNISVEHTASLPPWTSRPVCFSQHWQPPTRRHSGIPRKPQWVYSTYTRTAFPLFL